ncbi:dipeptide transmembrane transporter [Mytilinidion resinicola]|uniref:Dipeptide transmembrane transporter n=1 Tax=Mytilinidion resinicola TaxID=574789 RepID=A0A6A6YH41_9PEZI|nr:dipeptide transmembrane transporter [Mytilinidion resinicola]KAF2808121.1 dipeptide transmembrane transporter [Mytilinidion resinicola]
MSSTIEKVPSLAHVNSIDREKGELLVDRHADLGLQHLAKHGRVEYSIEEENAVRWKIDLCLMPILALTFGLQYLDKVTISYAAVYGIRKDLDLVGTQYSWANSIFYFGYLVGEIPSNYLMQKLPIGKFASANLLIWGVLVMLCAVCENFAGLATVRFLMGVFESCIGPCWVTITAMFYKGQEQGTRCTAWYFMVGVAAIVGGLLSYGVGHVDSIAIDQWQLVFLICGGFTVAWSVLVFLFLPDSPLNAKFLNERERSIAVERLRNNRTGIKTSQFKWHQVKEALRDPQVWMITLWAGISNICNIGGSFLPLIIEEMGFSGITTTLLTLPVGGTECVAMIVAGGASWYYTNGRTVIMFVVALPTLVGTILLEALPQSATWGRCVGVWLLLCVPASYAILLSLISSNIAGFSKKITTTFMVFVSFCVGNIVSPQLFLTSEAPHYGTGCRAMLVAICLCQALSVGLGWYYRFQNKKRDRVLAEAPVEAVNAASVEDEEFLDRTDMEDALKFRYRW